MELIYSSNNSYEQICSGYLENGISKFSCITLSIFLSFLVLPLLYGIIWYEKFGTDLKRTLINQLFGSICWYLLISIVILQFPVTIRFMFQKSFHHVICATLDFIATTFYNLFLGKNITVSYPVSIHSTLSDITMFIDIINHNY